MLELPRLTEDNAERYITDLLEALEYLFTHIDTNSFTADMREKWDALTGATEELKKSSSEHTSKSNERFKEIETSIDSINYNMSLFQNSISQKIRDVAYPVGSCVVSNVSTTDAIEEIYDGTWAKFNEIYGTDGMTKSYVYKRIE